MSGEPGMKAVAVRGGVIIAMSQAVRIGTQTISVVLLSRLLNPTDFGLVASIAPFTAFAMMLQGLGLQQAVVRQKDMPLEQIRRIFWLTTGISLFPARAPRVCALLQTRAPPVPRGAPGRGKGAASAEWAPLRRESSRRTPSRRRPRPGTR